MIVALFDIDGTVSDDRWRRHLMPNWDAYHAGSGEDLPVNQHLIDQHAEAGHRIVFITARPEALKNQTKQWLDKNFPNLWYDLLMRPQGNGLGSAELKLKLLEDAGYTNVQYAYDDRADVIEMYKNLNIKHATLITLDENPVVKLLNSMADTFRERNATYGNTYLQFGHAAAALWPRGFHAQTTEEFQRMGFMVQCLNKLLRYASVPNGHKDSAHDLAVYAAMLESVTHEN